MGQIFLEVLLNYMEDKEGINETEHDFSKCSHVWLIYLPFATVTTEINYLDFFKAFDRLPFDIASSELERYGWKVR